MNKLYRILIRKLSVSHGDWTIALPKPNYGPIEVQRSVLMNGTKVTAAKPLGAQIGACTVMYQAGSRYEYDDYIGASHFLRAASSLSSYAFSGFTKMRFVAQQGAAITCTSNRQSIAYTLRCPVTSFSELKSIFLDTVSRCCFREWEIEDIKPMIRDDLHRIHPESRVIDLAQKACWSGPLANSMYCEPSRIDGMTGDLLAEYTNQNYKSDHCSVASVGVPFDDIMKMAEAIEPRRVIPETRSLVVPLPRRGFESYDLGPMSETWICVVVPGCGTDNIWSLLQHAIVAHACGTGNMQEGSHTVDRMAQKPLGLLPGSLHTSYRAFNISYYETGVFGIVARTCAETAWKVAIAAADFLSKVGHLHPNQIEIGKKRLKLSLAIHDEDCVKLTEGLALQMASGVAIDSAKASIALIDQISNDQVSSTAQSLSMKHGDMALAVVGDTGRVPHERELICKS